MASARCHCQRGRGGQSEAAGPGLAPGLVLSVPGSCGEGSRGALTKRDHWTEPRGALVDLPVAGHRSCDPRRGRDPLGREGTGGPGMGTATGKATEVWSLPRAGASLCGSSMAPRRGTGRVSRGRSRARGAISRAFHVGSGQRRRQMLLGSSFVTSCHFSAVLHAMCVRAPACFTERPVS